MTGCALDCSVVDQPPQPAFEAPLRQCEQFETTGLCLERHREARHCVAVAASVSGFAVRLWVAEMASLKQSAGRRLKIPWAAWQGQQARRRMLAAVVK